VSTTEKLKTKTVVIAAVAIAAVAALIFAAPITHSLALTPAAQEYHGMIGKVDIVLTGEDGGVKDERHFDNLVLNDGFFGTAYRTFGHNGSAVSAVFDRIAIGDSSTAAAAGQHVLQGTELSRGQDSAVIYNNSTKKVTVDFTFGAGVGTGTVRESGLFNSASANTGPMLARQTFSDINKGASDSLTVTWQITLS
jgi:hypothetical protein